MSNEPSSRRNVFEGSPLDRLHPHREDEAYVRRVLRAEDTVVVPVRDRKSLVTSAERPSAVLLPVRELSKDPAEEESWTLLGVLDGRAHLAVDVSRWPEEELDGLVTDPCTWTDLHGIGALLDPREASLLAYARAILTWHGRRRHCGRCGGPTRIRHGGHARRCEACGALDFPRTDPAVIVLIHEGDRCLLGRQAEWPEGLYSTLAGFVEPGESLEECIRREVREEAGVALASVDFHSSQPWPFPSSIMIGFTATTSGAPEPRPGPELESVRWFRRERLDAMLVGGELRLPPRVSIGRRMIDEWRRGELDGGS